MRQYLGPMFLLLALIGIYIIFMPTLPVTSFAALDLHQQAIAASAYPTIAISVYWFYRANKDAEHPGGDYDA